MCEPGSFCENAAAVAVGAMCGAAVWLYMSAIWSLSLWAHRAKHARLEAWDRGEARARGVRGWIAHELARRELEKRCARLPSPGDLLLPKRGPERAKWIVAESHAPQPPTPEASVTLLLADDPLAEPVVLRALQFSPEDYEVVSASTSTQN